MAVKIAGDSIIDWIIKNSSATPYVGGAGNIVRGLEQRGYDVEFLTLYNPMLYPMSYAFKLHPNSLTDFEHRNVFVRDYDRGVFQRFRENLKVNVLDVKDMTAVICHEDSVIRKFESFYADVRDTSVKGKCTVLRMSSSDDYEKIINTIEHQFAIVTFSNKVIIRGLDIKEPTKWNTIEFEKVKAVDDVGAGDSFDVGFIDYFFDYMNSDNPFIHVQKAVMHGIRVAQEKVQKVGVFND